MAYWYPFLGFGVFWVSFIVGIILFSMYKKIYLVFYMISIALYIFTAGFMVDVLDIGKLGILTILIFSSLVFMILGYYLSRVIRLEARK